MSPTRIVAKYNRSTDTTQVEFLGRPKSSNGLPSAGDLFDEKEVILELKNLNVGYGKVLVRDLNLSINKGDRIAIIGPSGVGKTTLLRTLSGLIAPLSGEIIHDFSPRGQIGYIPQKLGLVRHSSARNNIMTGARTRKSKFYPPFLGLGTKINLEVDEILKRLGIEDLANEPVRILSGGQQRRVAIARALIQRPKLIVADEFLGELDVQNIDSIIDIIQSQLDELGTTLVMVEHQEDIARSIANRIWRIVDNKIIEEV